jgi:hypothetical protein
LQYIQYAYGDENCNMHIAQKLSPVPKFKWAFWFKHTLAVLATAAPPPAAAEVAADGEAMVVDMMAETEAANGHTTVNQKAAAIAAEIAVEAAATAAAVAEMHTTINQKAAAIVAEMAVKAATMAAALAEAKTVAEGGAATSRLLVDANF